MIETKQDNRGLIQAALADGIPLLIFTGLSLVLSGGFAIFLAVTGQFLPHDIAFLGLSASELCRVSDCRIVGFMIHDRAAFGGVLVAIGLLYMWLAEFPLRNREQWAWWTLLISGIVGFGSFLGYIGYGYLDSWHGVATLLLIPCFVTGLIRSRGTLVPPLDPRTLLVSSEKNNWNSRIGFGRMLLLATAFGLIGSGMTISIIGATVVFVPEDLKFIGLSVQDLLAINPRLLSLIAHDRAGFGGGLLSSGLLLLPTIWCARPSKNLWEILAIAGIFEFGMANATHLQVGYLDLIHLSPSLIGAILFALGLAFTFQTMHAATTVPAVRSR